MLTCLAAERLWRCRTNESCALNIQPCLLNNQVITTVDLVKDLPFNALPFQQFFDGYVGCPANNLVRAQRCSASLRLCLVLCVLQLRTGCSVILVVPGMLVYWGWGGVWCWSAWLGLATVTCEAVNELQRCWLCVTAKLHCGWYPGIRKQQEGMELSCLASVHPADRPAWRMSGCTAHLLG